MAYESNLNLATLPGTTGLVQYQAVIVNSAGRAAKPGSTAGIAVVGVTQVSSSANDVPVTVALTGSITKIKAAASTLSAGDQFQCSSAGRAEPLTAGAYSCGYVVSGSSGGADRVLTVALMAIGTT